MQKRFYSTEFLIILLFFALPPIVFPPALSESRFLHFSWITFALALAAGGLFWQMKILSASDEEKKNKDEEPEGENKNTRRLRFFLQQGESLITFGGLLVCSGLCEVISRFLLHEEKSLSTISPENIWGWINALAGIICAAFYEEVLYRMYLPDMAKKLLTKQHNTEKPEDGRRKKIAWVCEIAAVILFALAHRYAGWLSVVNAAAGGILLRRCYIKTTSLWTNLTAHVLYNGLMTAISLL